MAGPYRVQNIFVGKSEMPEDQFVNTFHFVKDGPDDDTPLSQADAIALAGAVEQFFYSKVNPVSTDSVFGLLSAVAFATNPRRVKVYDMSGAPPHPPVYDSRPTGQPANNTFQALPAEVAICLSYSSLPQPGINMARQRGRVYIGPLNIHNLGVDAAGVARPGDNVTLIIRQAGIRLHAAAIAAGYRWVVHSPATAAGVDPDNGGIQFAGQFPVQRVWTDNAFDTQRRRGATPSAKTIAGLIT